MNKPPQPPKHAESARLGGAPVPDPDAPPSEEEIIASDALRQALENPSLPNEGAELARAVSLAHRPRPLEAALHAELVENAIRGASKPRSRQGGGGVVRVLFGASAALAVAASVALILGTMERDQAPAASIAVSAPAAAPTPYRARSTQPLFAEPFDAPLEKAGERSRPSSGSARVDRIAMARASEFRENEFSRWGAR